MTYAPKTLTALGAYWTAQGGVNLGIVGDANHLSGYHCGRDRIYGPGGQGDDDYSVRHPRDKAGLSGAASAIDLGRLDGSLDKLYAFSRDLVAACQNKAPGYLDVREVIYSPDGVKVQRYSGVDGIIHSGPGNGDASHIGHTHVSYFRDSENRTKTPLFAALMEGDNVAQRAITTVTPKQLQLHAGQDIFDLDGKTKLADLSGDRVVYSPCGRGTASDGRRYREWYTDLDGAGGSDPKRSVLCRVADADIVGLPVPEPPAPSPVPQVLTGDDGSQYRRV